jgi:hypothetical protein
VDFNTPRTLRRLSACGSASEIRLAGISADTSFHAIVRIAAEPIIIAFAGVRIRLNLRIPALRRRERSLYRRCRCGRCWPPLMVMPGRGGLGPSRGHGEHGADRDHHISEALHAALLLSQHEKKAKANGLMEQQKYRTGTEPVNRRAV